MAAGVSSETFSFFAHDVATAVLEPIKTAIYQVGLPSDIGQERRQGFCHNVLEHYG